ncbi:MAG: hypothetical protein SGJ11_04495 [Phycisphaerae bacterium]|nr:hypothetical protein [Phycisphaerae bacterium]
MEESLQALAADGEQFEPEIVAAVLRVPRAEFSECATSVVRLAHVASLKIGWFLEEDLRTPEGELLLKSGHEVTQTLVDSLPNYARRHLLPETARVRIPLPNAQAA